MEEYIFDQYRVFYRSGPSDYTAKITCYNDKERVAMIFFMEERALPENTLVSQPMKIYYHSNRFQDILRILENEQPLAIYVFENKKTCEIGSRELFT